jgi:hypothetical protein
MRPAQLAGGAANVSPVDDRLTELLAELLVRAWRRRHAGQSADPFTSETERAQPARWRTTEPAR